MKMSFYNLFKKKKIVAVIILDKCCIRIVIDLGQDDGLLFNFQFQQNVG